MRQLRWPDGRKENKLQQENTELELYIEYLLKENQVTVLSCKGFGTAVTVPDFIKGHPVIGIGAYAFSESEKGLALLPEESEVFYEKIAGIKVPGSREEPLSGRRLKEITLPKYLKVVEKYAFYNCRELERVNTNPVHLNSGRLCIENGAFMNCDKLKYIKVNGTPEEEPAVREILMELDSELCVTYSQGEEKSMFLFPDYYEYSIENTPARITQELLYGAGYRYRQCFREGILDVPAYDEVFQAAEIQTLHETALRIAFLRLQYPYGLLKKPKERYLDFISAHIQKALNYMILRDDINGLGFLSGLGLLSERNYIEAQEEAVRLGRRECAGLLLKERLLRYPPAEKEYDL